MAKREINNLTIEDVAVVWGGANDMGKNESPVGLRHIKHYVVNWKHRNIVVMNYPYRHGDSVVGIATRYGLNGPGIESRWGRGFLQPSRPALGPTQPPIQWVPVCGRGVELTTHPHLVPGLKKE